MNASNLSRRTVDAVGNPSPYLFSFEPIALARELRALADRIEGGKTIPITVEVGQEFKRDDYVTTTITVRVNDPVEGP